MKNFLILIFLSALCFSQTNLNDKDNMNNPFFSEYSTPFKTPPFNLIKLEHYLPAFEEGMKRQKEEVNAIVNNPEEPTFDNTIAAMEKTGVLLTKVANVFFNLLSSLTNDDMQKLSEEISPKLSKHSDEISFNEKLFERIKKIYQKKDKLNLTTEQQMLLKKYYKDFVRSGANLNKKDKEKLGKINEEFALLSLKFGQNLLKETNNFEMVIDNESDLEGLPESVKQAAYETAKQKGKEGKWVFTPQKPSWIPFLTYSTKRDLRQKLYAGYFMRGDNNNEFDNKAIIKKILKLRIDKAKLLGYKTFSDYVLDNNMAKNPKNVFDLLNKIWAPALKVAKQERDEMQKMIDAEGGKFKLAPWDWWYYAEKVKKAKYDLDEEMLRPYFKLENVIEGVFALSNKLWGLQFTERKDIPIYHPEVKVFEVKEADGRHVGILYTDYFPRESKRGGAWMNELQQQHKLYGEMVPPIICNVGNFTKPTADKPALLSVDDVNTLFHEFGHALHGLLSNCTYPTIAGTNVARDFVELPSQVMENWCLHPDVLKLYAKHYQTGEVIPKELIDKLEKTKHFNAGFEVVEYVAAALLDMDWHTQTSIPKEDVNSFEKKAMKKIGLIPEILPRYRSTYFQHIFAGDGYSSGYYSYIWAQVLDADAFQAFVETGDVFNQKLAKLFRENVLSKGGSEEPMTLYKKFRGSEPKVESLLKRRGLL